MARGARGGARWLARAAPRALATFLFCVSGAARAEDGLHLTVPVEASMSRWSAPAMVLNGQDVPRRLVGVGAPSPGQFYGVGAGLDHGAVDAGGGGLYFSLLRLRVAYSGSSNPITETVGGSPVTVTRDHATLVEVGLPLVSGGVVYSANRFLLRFGLESGWAYLSAKTTVQVASGEAQRGTADAGSFFMHFPVAACVLAHPFGAKDATFRDGEDVCLTFTPTLYEFGLFNGFSAGLRVDF